MMEDPKRLLSAHGGATCLERELLESVPNMGPPEGAKARAWEALAAQLATATVVGTGVSTGKAASAAAKVSLGKGALGSKIIAVVIAGGLTAGGGIWALSPAHDAAPRASAPVAPPPVATREKASAPEVPPEVPAEHAGEDNTAEAAGASKPRKLSALTRQDSLLRESALLKQARAQLQAGDAKAARASLDRLASEFPDGVLGQEREVLAIAVLSAQGQVKLAQQRARAFVKAHPRSPHSAAMHELLEPP